MALLVVESPHRKSYKAFFEAVILRLSKSSPGVDVLISLPMRNTGELNVALLTIYTLLRQLITDAGFPYTFQIDVLLNSQRSYSSNEVYTVKGEKAPSQFSDYEELLVEVTELDSSLDSQDSLAAGSSSTSAVGGTFDHLHDGHKILLLLAVFVALKRVIVGVTGPKLLEKKKFAEQLELLQVRVNKVARFLQKLLPPHVDFQIYKINDVCGPTGYVDDIQALIISDETAKGAAFVNEYRTKMGFHALEVISVKVIGGDGTGNAENNWKGKLSSTDLREIEARKSS